MDPFAAFFEPPPPQRVLCVDDEPQVLDALTRALRAPDLALRSAAGGAEALALLDAQPADLLLTDLCMPGMSGLQLLEQAQARYPDTVRLVLSGPADLRDTLAAINRGSVFRYLQKPWNDDELRHAVRQGLAHRAQELERRRLEALTLQQNEALQAANEQLEARVAQRTSELSAANEQLRHAHLTAVQIFSSLLEMRSRRLMGHGRRVADLSRRIGKAMGCSDEELQEIVVAALLHDIGFIALPDDILQRPLGRLADDKLVRYREHPATGEQTLMALETTQGAAALIRAHHERWDGEGFPDRLAGEDIPFGARIIAVADVFDALCRGLLLESSTSVEQARVLIRRGSGTQFDPEVVQVFLQITLAEPQAPPDAAPVPSDRLQPGMVLAADLLSSRGLLLLTRGRRLTGPLIGRIRALQAREGKPLLLQIRTEAAAGPAHPEPS